MMRVREWLKASLAASLIAGCSDPAPPAASAGLDMNITFASDPPAGTTCSAIATYALGNPAPSATERGVPATDGAQADQRITCTVRGDGTFQVSGDIQATGLNIDNNMLGPLNFALSNGSVTAGGTGTARLSVFTREASLDSDPASPCTIDVSTAPLTVEAGGIWARYSCRMQNLPSLYCQVSGVMLFENCLSE